MPPAPRPLQPPHPARAGFAALGWLLGGLLLVAVGWLTPAYWRAVSPAVLRAAGAGTPSLSEHGLAWLARERPGPAALVLAAAQAVGAPEASRLAEELAQAAQRQPDQVPWGGWDPYLEPLFQLPENRGRTASTPVLSFFITSAGRTALAAYLDNSRSEGVQALLRLRSLDRTTRFVPVGRAGGQTLDTVVLLAALLYQSEALSEGLQTAWRASAEDALRRGELTAAEPWLLDLLTLGRRLDWAQLGALLRNTEDLPAMSGVAGWVRTRPEGLAKLVSAIWLDGGAARVLARLDREGEAGWAALRISLALGTGAVRALGQRPWPLDSRELAMPELATLRAPLAELVVQVPLLAHAVRYLSFLFGVACLGRALQQGVVWLVTPRVVSAGLPRASADLHRANSSATAGPHGPDAPAPAPETAHRATAAQPVPTARATTARWGRAALLTLGAAGLLAVLAEPNLWTPAASPTLPLRLAVPVLASLSDPTSLTTRSPTLAMDINTLLSIGFFALLQLAIYFYCLAKLREIEHAPVPAALRLRLLDNEENLFDGGLYLGIGGTATALVLQVLQVIEPNLLAAYSSNLFGITCVAVLKIRHVRPCKRRLILASAAEAAPAAPASLPTASAPATSPAAPAQLAPASPAAHTAPVTPAG